MRNNITMCSIYSSTTCGILNFACFKTPWLALEIAGSQVQTLAFRLPAVKHELLTAKHEPLIAKHELLTAKHELLTFLALTAPEQPLAPPPQAYEVSQIEAQKIK